MGSSASTDEKPTPVTPPKGNSKAPSTNRNKGFQEVEIKSNNPAPSGSRSQKPQNNNRRGGGNRLKERVDKATEGKDTDFHNVVKNANNKKNTKKNNMIPQYPPDQDLALETFYHNDGNVYTCLYQGGARYFLNFLGSQDWEPFPKKWYGQGYILTESVIQETNEPGAGPSSGAQGTNSNSKSTGATDDREGHLMHPSRGKLSTYIYEEKRNVHYFFEKDSGSWVRLPVAWELHSELVQKLIAPIQEALPNWKDQHDILAALRASNYDPHDCIAHFLAIGTADDLQSTRNGDDAKLLKEKENKIREQQEQIDKLKRENEDLQKDASTEKEEKRQMSVQVDEMMEQVAELQAELGRTSAQLESLNRPKTPGRPRTAKAHESREAVNPESLNELSETAKQLHKEYTKLKMETTDGLEDVRALMKQLTVAVMRLKLADSNSSSELEEFKSLYKREALQRKLLYNRLQEIQGNIRVFCRCRYDSRVKCCLTFPTDQDVQPPNGKKLMFDKVFTPQSTQEEVYNEAKAIITSCVDGYNVCILAYGQTGSGKTHTMMGPKEDPGVNVRAIKELLTLCNDRDNINYTLCASMVEIYNETIQDLLTKSVNTLDIRTQGNKIVLPGITEMPVKSEDDINSIMDLGQQNRTTAATKMNSTSSRSHLIFMIKVEGEDKSSGVMSNGTLTLCDLAGSERVSKTEAQGKRLVEAAAINKSLTSLGQVFTSLRQGALHVPYRNSKLTHILQPSLGGDAKACLFVAVSPDSDNVSESVSTLTFGSNARQVQLGEAKKHISKKGPPMPH